MKFFSVVISVLLFSTLPASAQFTIQFDTVGVWLTGVDRDTLFVAFRDKPGKQWRIDTTGVPHLDAAKAGQRITYPDSIYAIFQRSNSVGVADSFQIRYASGHPTRTDTTIGPVRRLIGGVSAFGDVTSDSAYVLSFTWPSTWFKMFITHADTVDTTFLRTIFVRKEKTH